ncbi:amidohydrolase family protein [Niastella vici]|nr:amidohydrolase family protein [Niastella vici]
MAFLIFLFMAFVTFTASAQGTDTIVIEHVNVIPMTAETVLKDQRVLIAGGKIIKIEEASQNNIHTTGLSIPAAGKYLIPGLSEMHFHFRSNDIASDIKLLLANGITIVRNMAEFPGQHHIEIRQKTQSGGLPHLNYFTTGPYLTSKDLGTIEKVVEVVKMHIEEGYDFLKIAGNLPMEIYLKLLDECEKDHLPVIGHAQRDQPVEYSLRMSSIEHIEEFLYLSDSAQHPSIFRQPDARIKQLVQQIKESGIYIGTTLAVFQFINNCLNDTAFRELQQHPLVKYLAKKERENFLSEKNDYRKMKNRVFDGVKAPELFNDYFIWMKKFARMLSDAGVPLLSGSDTYGMVIVGFSLHNEFSLLQEAGISPYRILLASTVTPARYLGRFASEGTITVGKNANLVLLDKNPLDDIKNTTSIAGVFLRGQWFNRKKLDLMLSEVEQAFK